MNLKHLHYNFHSEPTRDSGVVSYLMRFRMTDNSNQRQNMHLMVISDNPELSEYLIQLLNRLPGRDDIVFQLFYSAKNQHPGVMKKLGATPINLKDPVSLENIILKANLVISLHCKQIFPERLVNAVTCINIHPGLNPFNRGWFPQIFSIINKKPAGVTVHLMDSDVDHGPVLFQAPVDILQSDTSLDVYRRIITMEKKLLEQHLADIIAGNYSTVRLSSEGNYNGIRDFETLCELDLNATGTLQEHLDLLRALTHGELRNAFFRDEQGRKYYVRLNFEADNASSEYNND